MGIIKKKQQQRRRRRRPTVEDFSALEEPHPYGVLPGGNRFFDKTYSRSRSEEVFSDSLWQHILMFCDATSLARVVQTSRYLYVAGHQPELWRDLVSRRMYHEKRVINQMGESWKDTYVCLFYTTKLYPPHTPIPVPGVYSDDYYRTHLCRSFAIPAVWLEEEDDDDDERTVPLVKSLTPQAFLEKYEAPNQPVILQGAGRTRALEKWHDPNYMLHHNAPHKSFRATSGAAPLPADFTLEAYHDYSKRFQYLEESPLYLFDRTAFSSNPQWSDDFFPEFYKNCPHWDPSGDHGHDLFQHLGEGRRPDHTWLIMGPKRSGSVFHIDPNATHAWNVCIQGRKRWIFYPPGVNPPGVFPSADMDEVALPLSVGEWLIQYWKEHTQNYRKQVPPSKRPMECTVHPGDVVFVPHGWWHMAINLDEGTNMAITHNYVSPSNLGNVLKFVREKQDQISGCRDRTESVKPECLHEEFVKALQDKLEPALLKQAMTQSGWTCQAWNNGTTTTDTNGEVALPDLVVVAPKKEHNNHKKRPHTGGDDDDDKTEEQRTSVMAKTEKVPFTFSFL